MKFQRLKNAMKMPFVPVLIGLLAFAQAEAATVVGGSTLLDAARANQLESWLGEGALTLTNAYTKAAGDTSANFHSALDGGGRTFVVMSATENYGAGTNAIIGGYNPQSWNSTNSFNISGGDAERTAFIFNLSTTSLYRQNLSTELLGGSVGDGQYQTYNSGFLGPTFGGTDIRVTGGMDLGYSYLYSYSDAGNAGTSIVDGSFYNGTDVIFGAIEVFTISTTPIPEPETYALLLAGLGVLGFAVRRRKLKEAAAA